MKLCIKCGLNERRALGQQYCRECHNAYQRAWRKTHPLSAEARHKDNCRSYAGQYLRYGLIERYPCEICDEGESEMHHPDYAKPLDVRWLCRKHHLALHYP